MHRSPHCPACAAELPEIDVQQIVTCDCCGTDVNADSTVRRRAPDRSPPLSPAGPGYGRACNWDTGPVIHRLLTTEDPAEALGVAREKRARLGRDAVVWIPALLDGVDAAEAVGQVELALARANWLRDFQADARVTRMLLRRIEARRERFVSSDVTLDLLQLIGIAATKGLVELTTDAESRGDHAYKSTVLEALRKLMFGPHYDRQFGVLLDIHTWLIPTTQGAVRERLIDNVADLADLQFHEPGEQYESDWRGPEDVLTATLLWVEDLLHEDEPLSAAVLDRIVALHHKSSWHLNQDHERWSTAIGALGTARARDAAIAAMYRVFGPPPEEGDQSSWPTPDLHALLPALPDAGPRGVRVAQERNGQAPCPGCGFPLRLAEGRVLAECGSCGQPARIARAARQVRMQLHAGLAAQLLEWEPQRLITELLSTPDAALRAAILDEIAAATTDGARYVAFAPALVAFMLSDVPEDVEERIGNGLRSMLRYEDAEFREALFDAVRTQAFTVDGSKRLLRALGHAGIASVPLLLDLFDHATQAAEDWGAYAGSAQNVAFELLQWDMEDPERRIVWTDWMLGRMVSAGPMLSEQLPVYLGYRLFEAAPACGPPHEAVLRFIDDHTNPACTQFYPGLKHGRPEVFQPNWSADFEAYQRAAEQAGYESWADACERGGYHIEKLLQQISAMAPGGPTLRQIGQLGSQVDSFWSGPESTDDLMARLAVLEKLGQVAPRLLVLNSIQERPADWTRASWPTVEAIVMRFEDEPHLAPSVAHVRSLLSGQPAQTTRTDEGGNPWWRFWG